MKKKTVWIVAKHGPYQRTYEWKVSGNIHWDSIVATLELHGYKTPDAYVPFHAITGVFLTDPEQVSP